MSENMQSLQRLKLLPAIEHQAHYIHFRKPYQMNKCCVVEGMWNRLVFFVVVISWQWHVKLVFCGGVEVVMEVVALIKIADYCL
jgi:hypothetical protein